MPVILCEVGEYLWSCLKKNTVIQLSQSCFTLMGKQFFFFLIGASCKISFIEGIMLIFLRVWETLALYNF